MRVLVVEDWDLFRDLIKSNAPKDWDVEEVFDGKDGIEKVDSIAFDLIMLDFNMPYYNGDEVIRHIRSGVNKNTIVIAMSSVKENNDDLMCGGANCSFTKGEIIEHCIECFEVIINMVKNE